MKRLNNERKILKMFQRCPHIRPLLDQVEEPPALVLKFLEDNLLKASNTKRLEKSELKHVARKVLEALNKFHEAGYAHTDVKPDNIFVNYGDGTNRFSQVQLGDCADAYRVDSDSNVFEVGHVIGTAIFAVLKQISSCDGVLPPIFGFLVPHSYVSYGGEDWHIFKPKGYTADHPDYPAQVLLKQASIFGPFPKSYIEIADEERMGVIAIVNNHIHEAELWKPFSMAEDPELSIEDRDFICKIMRMDPRDRPTAKELLEDPWFH